MSNSHQTGIIETRVFIRSQDEEGITHLKVKPDSDVTKDDLLEINKKCSHFYENAPEKSVILFTDNCFVKSVTREVRNYIFSEGHEEIKLIKCNAVLVRSSIDRILISFVLLIRKPPFPLKIFNSRERALEWLRKFK